MRFLRRSLMTVTLIGLAVAYGCADHQMSWPTRKPMSGPRLGDRDAAQAANQDGLEKAANEDWPSAGEAFQRALDHDLSFPAAWNNLGITYLHRGKYYDAAWAFTRASKLAPKAVEPRVNLGLVFEAVGSPERAITAYDEALTLRPNDHDVMSHLANAKLRAGEQDHSLRELLKRVAAIENDADQARWAKEQLARMAQKEH